MADHQIDGAPIGGASFITKWRAGQAKSAGIQTYPGVAIGNLEDIQSLRAYLTGADANAYSAAKLNTMTLNDMVYAARLVGDANGF